MTHLLAAKVPVGDFTGEGWLGNTVTIMYSIRSLAKVISLVIGFLTIIGGLWFIFQFFSGALGWITAGSDKDGISRAQKRITNSLIGLLVVIFAFSIIALVGQVLGLDILDIETSVRNLSNSL